jgi:hypothetical protein
MKGALYGVHLRRRSGDHPRKALSPGGGASGVQRRARKVGRKVERRRARGGGGEQKKPARHPPRPLAAGQRRRIHRQTDQPRRGALIAAERKDRRGSLRRERDDPDRPRRKPRLRLVNGELGGNPLQMRAPLAGFEKDAVEPGTDERGEVGVDRDVRRRRDLDKQARPIA